MSLGWGECLLFVYRLWYLKCLKEIVISVDWAVVLDDGSTSGIVDCEGVWG